MKSKCEPLPSSQRLTSLQTNLVVFESFYRKADDQMETILQVDGNSDILDEEGIPKCLYSVNCEYQALITWMNFFRSFDFFWEGQAHCICTFDIPNPGVSPCFFCLMRSSSLRLRIRGQKGPKSLKPYEALSQLGQLERKYTES